MTPQHRRLTELLSRRPLILAPMEDVTDAVFRKLCRELGAELCVTEFVNAEGLLRGARIAQRKLDLRPDDTPTAIQIYGSDPGRLAEAARVAEAAGPAYIDINCGCWVPKVAQRGAGAGWLRDPKAMVEMAGLVVRAVGLPVTVKTRIGWGPESEMPIVDLARRLEDVGVAALTIHCRVARVGHSGAADWQWARRAREVVKIPVIVNGDVSSAEAFVRAMAETGCAGAMVGRAAIDHPWIFREARALDDRGETLPPPTVAERFDVARRHLVANCEARGERFGVQVTRRHLGGYLRGLPRAAELRRTLFEIVSLQGCLDYLARCEEAIGAGRGDELAGAPRDPRWVARARGGRAGAGASGGAAAVGAGSAGAGAPDAATSDVAGVDGHGRAPGDPSTAGVDLGGASLPGGDPAEVPSDGGCGDTCDDAVAAAV